MPPIVLYDDARETRMGSPLAAVAAAAAARPGAGPSHSNAAVAKWLSWRKAGVWLGHVVLSQAKLAAIVVGPRRAWLGLQCWTSRSRCTCRPVPVAGIGSSALGPAGRLTATCWVADGRTNAPILHRGTERTGGAGSKRRIGPRRRPPAGRHVRTRPGFMLGACSGDLERD